MLPVTSAPKTASSSPPPEPSSARQGGSETILLVEDDAQIRGVTQLILERLGYQVLVASGADAALSLARENVERIDLLLTDVVMPGMSGPLLADRFGSVCPSVPVLYMSGHTDDAIVQHGVLNAGIDFLHKPVTPESLSRKVREVLDR
jgi:DNA-binding NtrC family response regulator